MDNRLKLQSKLESLLGSGNVYFQPPETIKLKYPCIVYSLDPTYTAQADNRNYRIVDRYHVKHIYKSLSNTLKDQFLTEFIMISHDNRMIADGMYNDDFTLYF